MNLKTGVTAVIIAFVIFFIMSSPDNAATIAHNAWGLVENVAQGLKDFINKLTA